MSEDKYIKRGTGLRKFGFLLKLIALAVLLYAWYQQCLALGFDFSPICILYISVIIYLLSDILPIIGEGGP